MAFRDNVRFVDAFCERSWGEFTGISSEAHRAAHRIDSEQVAQFEDHRVRRIGVELSRIGVFNAADVARVFYRRALQTQADAEERLLFAARVGDGADHSRNSALAKPPRNKYRVNIVQNVFPPVVGHQVFALNPAKIDAQVVGEAAVDERLVEALVRIFELDVFADDADG